MGPMVARLLVERMAHVAVLAGLTAPQQAADGLVASPEKLEILGQAALTWLEAILMPFRRLPFSPYPSDEAVATALLQALEEQRAHA